MPTTLSVPVLLRVRGYEFRFFTADRGERPHVHVYGNGGDAKIWLAPEPSVATNRRYDRRRREEVLRITTTHREAWLAAWNALFER